MIVSQYRIYLLQAAKFSATAIFYTLHREEWGRAGFLHTCFLRDELLLATSLFDIELDQWQAIFLPVLDCQADRGGGGSGLAASSKGREGEYVILITYVSECTVCVDRTGNLQKKSHSPPSRKKIFDAGI